MPDTKNFGTDDQNKKKSIDDYLDEALQETFPASDPVAISGMDKKIPSHKHEGNTENGQ